MINRTAFNVLLRPGVRRDFRDEYKAFEQEYSMFLKTGNMDMPFIEAATMSGLPRQVQLGELEPFTVLDPKISDVVRYTDTPFGLAVAASKESMKDDQYGKLKQSAKWLGRSTRLTQEYEGAELLNDAFTGTVFTGAFGEPLISSAHTLLGTSGTWSNQVAGNPQLGVTGLQAALELAERTVDQNGDPIVIRPSRLIIGVSDEWMAIQLLQNEAEPFTSNNNVNATRRKRQLSYTVSHYMTQTGRRWFLQDPAMHDAHFLFRERPSFPDWYEEMVRAAYFASYQRFLVYFYDPRGWVGSNAA